MTDVLLMGWVASLIERARLKWMLGAGEPWRPGRKLSLLFAGYNGTRNTGSDVRVEEMLRQIRHILGEDKLELSVMSQNFAATRGYFSGVRQVHLPDVYPPFLYREVPQHHGVVACEGSMFKSKFANALTTMMIGSLGIAAAQNKLSVGYGAEAGEMDPLLAAMCRRYCRESFIITRNEESRVVLSQLGIPSELGTDTAWTFEPLGTDYSRRALAAAGWDERRPVLVACPINPFWWPVKPSLAKLVARTLTGAYKDSQYRTIYFHTYGPERRAAYRRYLDAWAKAMGAFAKQRGMFVVLVAMERLDALACRDLSAQLGGAPVFTSDDYDMYQLVSVLRCADLMISSRYHAIVTSMPARVPSAGITMDERIRNLMHERGHQHLLLTVDDPELEAKLLEVMKTLWNEREAVREAMGRVVVKNLKLMARMGVYFEEHIQQRYPDFPVRGGILSWEDYLPPLSPTLRALAEEYETAEAQVAP
ncbi:MAG TPA: polysaccharide pyruvyl transferase family protein [Candidatus Xenobia bacterium]|nr:polysaccharide pyruvyl transferase family protein [Candidatus Xenobia bacterium]